MIQRVEGGFVVLSPEGHKLAGPFTAYVQALEYLQVVERFRASQRLQESRRETQVQ